MNRRTMMKSTLGGVAAVVIGTIAAGAQTPVAGEMQAKGSWKTTTDSRIERLKITITAFASEDEAHQQFEGALAKVKEGTIYNETIKTYGDESFIVLYQLPMIAEYEATARVGNLVYFVAWDAVFIDGHVEGLFLFEDLIARAKAQDSYTQADLDALLPTKEELAELELEADT